MKIFKIATIAAAMLGSATAQAKPGWKWGITVINLKTNKEYRYVYSDTAKVLHLKDPGNCRVAINPVVKGENGIIQQGGIITCRFKDASVDSLAIVNSDGYAGLGALSLKDGEGIEAYHIFLKAK